jgi:hypothetical protein
VRGKEDRPIAKSTLNQAVKALGLDIEHFVLHDFRRTAASYLCDMGLPSSALERALARTAGEDDATPQPKHANEQRNALQRWADFVDAQTGEGGQR